MKTRLADIAEIRTGFAFRGRVMDDPAGQLPVVQMKDIRGVGRLTLESCVKVQQEPNHRKHLLNRGDVLLQSRGTRFPAGVLDDEVQGIAALGVHVLRAKPGVLPAYLVWLLNHAHTQGRLQSLARGSQIPFLSVGDLAELSLPLPSLEQQQKIAEVARLELEVAELQQQLEIARTSYITAATWRAANSK